MLDEHALSRLFPTEGETGFGVWVKAGALKPGDRLSTRGSIEAANDDDPATPTTPLTLRSIERDDTGLRVYNFAVQSLPGEVTHNYLVGGAEWWTHNAQPRGSASLPKQGTYQSRIPAKRLRFNSRKAAYQAAKRACAPGQNPKYDYDSVSGKHFHPRDANGNQTHDHYKF